MLGDVAISAQKAEQGFELARLISNWTPHLTLFTNGPSTLGPIPVEEKEIASVEHRNGYVQHIVFTDHSIAPVKAIYIRPRFEQHCKLPEALGCELTPEGYLKTDGFQETTVSGVYACGDNASPMRTVASAVASGTATGLFISRKIILT